MKEASGKTGIRTWHIQTLYWLSPLSALVAQGYDRWGFFDQKKKKKKSHDFPLLHMISNIHHVISS